MSNAVQCRGTVGSIVELYCSFNCSNNVVSMMYKWQKAGKVLSNSSEMIKLSSFLYTDAGDYQCKAFSDGHEVFCGQIALITGSSLKCLHAVCLSVRVCVCESVCLFV